MTVAFQIGADLGIPTCVAEPRTPQAYDHAVPTALISVYDKTGIVEFAQSLSQLGWSLISSGGTARAIADVGIPVTDVADVTGVPAILDHRVVTLHPKVHGGILADPTNPEHVADMPFFVCFVAVFVFFADLCEH